MKKTPLADYLRQPNNNQAALAAAVGFHQTAISRMLIAKRKVFVVERDDGKIELHEEKILVKAA